MIVGTAGHIDHGKTTLVRALTGVDTDRLPEEKQRGITIELGYAFMAVPDAGAAASAADGTRRIGFIDVPGHERLVHTMLAGATGIDYALLLVAADDGVMPQTREHLAVLSLLGLARGAVVVTKCDRVDAARVARVRADAAALLVDTPLAGAPVIDVSAHSGHGVEALRRQLVDAARGAPDWQPGDAAFRLAIDRAFTLDGVGTVVTGTVHAGQVAIGDELLLTPPSRGAAAAVRVRSLHAQNQAVERAHAGQRCAVALAGLAKDAVARGQWLVAPAVAVATERLDARLTLWHGEAKALRSGTPVHVHIGAADVLGTVALLRIDGSAPDAPGDSLPPGASALVQLVLRQPIGAWHGDRVVLRDASGSRTLAGGSVLDPFAPARYRRTPQRLSELAAGSHADARDRLGALLAAAPHGVDLRRWARAEGRAAAVPLGASPEAWLAVPPAVPSAAPPVASRAVSPAALPVAPRAVSPAAPPASPRTPSATPPATLRAGDAQSDWALGAAPWAAARAATVAALRAFHARQPDELGPDAARLRRLAAPRLPEPLWRALLDALQADRSLARRGAFVHLPEHALQLSAIDGRLAQKIAPLLAEAGFEGAWARDLARDTRESEVLVRTTLARLAQRGELHQVVKDLFYAPAVVARLAAIVREAARGASGEVTAAAFRDATGLGRKRAIQVLEYFDRVGLLRRVGDAHRLRADSSLLGVETV